METPYCRKHDRPYEDTSLTRLLPFYECPECVEEEAGQEQDWLSLQILAGYVPPEPKL